MYMDVLNMDMKTVTRMNLQRRVGACDRLLSLPTIMEILNNQNACVTQKTVGDREFVFIFIIGV
jgi:hypothetical protein